MRAALAALTLAGLVLAAGAVALRAAPAAEPEPPFHITGDHLTGGHGPEGDVVFLEGNVRVVRTRTVLTADNARYLRSTGMIDLNGHVRLVDSTTTVTCDHAMFSENDNRLNVDGHVLVVDRDATLRAPAGWYDRRTGEAHLVGGVTGTEKEQRLSADEATYLRDSMVVKARGNVRGWDDKSKVALEALRVDFFRRTGIAIAEGDPLMRTKDDDGRETVLRAMRLRVNSQTRVAEALDSVRVERDTLRASAAYARFDDSTGVGLLLGSPRAWDNQTVVVGDTMKTFAEKRKLRRVTVLTNARMDYAGATAANAGETSRLEGRRIDAFVDENHIDSLMAVGKASNDYTAPGKAGKTNERNHADGDTILVYFADRKVQRARVQGSATGEYRPPVAEKDTVAIANEIVRYEGRHIDFVVPRNTIVLDGDAHLTYGGLELSARQVEFNSERQTLVAQGKPQLLDHGDQVDGRMMTYDLNSRVGTIYSARTAYEKGLYRGDRIRKVGGNELDVMNGSYSTCDLDQPHYHFSARWMKIYLKDKLVAKPVVFYLRNVPILALPFYVFPIKPGRHSGFLFPNFELGFNNRSGQFLRNAGYYWAPNDYMDLTLAGDYYQSDPSYAIRADGNYKLLYHFDGSFNGQFQHNDLSKSDDYVFTGAHTQDLSPRTRLIARGEFVSSRAYSANSNYGFTLEQRLNRFLTSNLSVSHSADWASMSAVFDRRQDLDADQSVTASGVKITDATRPFVPKVGQTASLPNLTTDAPNLSIQFPSRTIGSWGVFKDTKAETLLSSTYFNLGARFVTYGTHRALVSAVDFDTLADNSVLYSTTLTQQVLTRRAFASSFSLADARRLGGWLTVSPSIAGNAVVFDFDEQGHKVVPAATWASAMSMSTTYYGTFKPPVPGLAGIRHVVFPNVSLSYSPDFRGLQYRDSAGVLRNRFNSFGGIGISGSRSAFMTFSVDQRLQVKVKRGEQVTRIDNLVGWSTSSTYDFLWREHGLQHGLSPLASSVVIQPPGLLNASLSGVVDPYRNRPLQTFGYNVGFNLGSRGARKTPAALPVEQTARKQDIVSDADFKESWRVSLAYSYSGGYLYASKWNAQKTANGVIGYQMTPNWQFDYSAAYDVTQSLLLSQRFSLTRRIHCWDAVFTRSFVPGGQTEYYFRLGVHDQKEIYYERGSRAQSLGGIQ